MIKEHFPTIWQFPSVKKRHAIFTSEISAWYYIRPLNREISQSRVVLSWIWKRIGGLQNTIYRINFYRVCRLGGSIICSHARMRNKEGKRRRYRDGKFSRAVQRGSLALPWSTARLFVDRMAERNNASSTSSLTLPQMLGTSPDGGTSPRRAVSPLLEVRRPHCTLNCESCNLFLEDVYRHSTCPLCPWCTTADSVSCSRDRIQYPINYTINVLTQLPVLEDRDPPR